MTHELGGYNTANTENNLTEAAVQQTESREECCSTERKSHHSEKAKKSLIHRLNRIEGQIRGVKGLIEKDTYCDDVLNQISSIQSALNGVGKLLLEHHMKSCVIERIQEGDEEVIDELLTTVNKLMK
ncbi:metal-sensitive transcriptional regulator [Paenibacillus senegalensis]|uniref:metal-sensitive transcriptional regulator n=1 Tax=Paenibacillus senegalensis TaxID=1465766 RepID=UPI000288BCCC|nr:metal-sensitive transcriptional regulator [Paenibacillus senegalensis]